MKNRKKKQQQINTKYSKSIFFILDRLAFLFIFGVFSSTAHATSYEGIGQIYLILFVLSPLLLLEGIVAVILSFFTFFKSLRLVKIFNKITIIIFSIGLVFILIDNGKGLDKESVFWLMGVMFGCSLLAILIPNIQYRFFAKHRKSIQS